MKLALVQMRLEPGAVQGNLAHAEKLVREGVKRGAEVVLLPEALPFGWTFPPGTAAQPIPGEHSAFFARLAKELHVYICVGLVESTGSRTFNSALLIGPKGDLLLHHRKIYELGIAHACYALGDRLGVAETPFGRVGLMICADGFAPGQVISRSLAMMGAELILSPCAWAVPPDHNNATDRYGKLWLENYGRVARDFGVWIAGCSNVGPVSTGAWAGYRCIGSSLVIGPDGEAKVSGTYGADAEEIILTEIYRQHRERAAAT